MKNQNFREQKENNKLDYVLNHIDDCDKIIYLDANDNAIKKDYNILNQYSNNLNKKG